MPPADAAGRKIRIAFRPGDPVPQFKARTEDRPDYDLGSAAGRYLVLCFFGSAGIDVGRRVVEGFTTAGETAFDDRNAAFFGVTIDPEDENQKRVRQRIPGFRFLFDGDQAISRTFGAVAPVEHGPATFIPQAYVLDPNLRVLGWFPVRTPESHVSAVLDLLRTMPAIRECHPAQIHAPVLVVPRVFEPALCGRLIAGFQADGGKDSGFMREVDGKTVGMIDHGFKRRRDWSIVDPALRAATSGRIQRRLAPEVAKAFQFAATRMERYLVACYDAQEGGYFRAHRDNTTGGTAHRRFAVTINLNAEDYEGGELIFPEYGQQTFRAPTGGAVVFSCSLLHEALPVTRGRRYAFLPFLYDEAAARARRASNGALGHDVQPYNLAGSERR